MKLTLENIKALMGAEDYLRSRTPLSLIKEKTPLNLRGFSLEEARQELEIIDYIKNFGQEEI